MTIRNMILAIATISASAAIAAPVYDIGLRADTVAIRGQAFDVTILAQPSDRIGIFTSADDTNANKVCPPVLNGDCLAVTEPFGALAWVTTDADGMADATVTIPRNAPDRIVIQAGATGNTATWLSSPIYIQVLDGQADADGDGISNGAEVALGMDPLRARF